MSAQHDDHIWLTVLGEGWAIHGIDGREFLLWRGYEPDLRYLVLDTSAVNWSRYCTQCAEDLERAAWAETVDRLITVAGNEA